MVRQMAMLLVLLALAPGLSGCSLIGLGIGATVTTYKTVQPPYEGSLAHGDEVRVLIAPPTPTPDKPSVTRFPRSYDGMYVGVRDDAMVLGVRRPRAIPLRDVQKIELVTGSHWRAGLGVGLILDAVAAIVVGHMIARFSGS